MSENIKSFLVGCTNAFKPIDYSEMKKIGEVSKHINDKISINRGLTVGKINEIITKQSISESCYTTT